MRPDFYQIALGVLAAGYDIWPCVISTTIKVYILMSFKHALKSVSVFTRASLEERLRLEENSEISNTADTAVGSKQLTFTLKKVNKL